MLACEPSKAPTFLLRLREIMIVFQYPRHLQVRLLFTWALEKKADMEHSTYWISTVRACRESLHNCFQQSWEVHQTYRRSYFKLLSTLIWMISHSREQLEPIWGQIWAGLEKHIFLAWTAVQSHPQVSSDVFEAHFDPEPSDSAAGPVPALEAVEASGRLARALQWKGGPRGNCAPWIQAWSFRQHHRTLSESEVPSLTGTHPKSSGRYY